MSNIPKSWDSDTNPWTQSRGFQLQKMHQENPEKLDGKMVVGING